MTEDRISQLRDASYERLYWFLTRKPLVKVGILAAIYIAVLLCFLIVYVLINVPDRTAAVPQEERTRTLSSSLPPTYTPALRESQVELQSDSVLDLKSKLDIALTAFSPEQERLEVQEVTIEGNELVIGLQRFGTPSMADYFSQLDLIHEVVARDNPAVEHVRTVDIEAQTGFIVDMKQLLSYYNGELEYDLFRDQWRYFEP